VTPVNSPRGEFTEAVTLPSWCDSIS
jgi:hypothetical protein